MDELKTLKDLTYADKFNRNKFSVRNNYEKLYSEKDLKSSAIKWIKKLEKDQKNNSCSQFGSFHDFEELNDYENVINWIKHRYNITEKDLNETDLHE